MRESWKRFSETVRSAKPGSSVYAPKPYLQSRADILADFEYAFRNTLVGKQEASKAVGASYLCSVLQWCPSISYCVICRDPGDPGF